MRFWRTQTLFFAALAGTLVAQSAQTRPGDWPMYNRDLAGTRYSPLTQINTTNVTPLEQGVVLSFAQRRRAQSPARRTSGHFRKPRRSSSAVCCISPPGNRVLALEPETGKEVWRYEPEDPGFQTRLVLLAGR